MFNIGETVRVKENASEITHHSIGFSRKMYPFQGEEFVVKEKREHYSGCYIYILEDVKSEDPTVNGDGYWMWVKEWLEPVCTTKIEVSEDDFMTMFEGV